MINDTNLQNLYEKVINDDKLTTKQLKECGFNSNDITKLVREEILRRDKIGYYSFVNDTELYKYGKQLLSLKQFEKVNACFEKCYQINPYNYETCFQLFMRNIKAKKYDKAFEYFDKFFDSGDMFYDADHDFYLYLLSFITSIPEKYKAYSKCIGFNEIKVSKKDERYENVKLHNQLRQAALNQKFGYAYKFLCEIMKNDKMNKEIELIRTLLKQVFQVQKNNTDKVLNLLKNKDYDSIIKFMENVQECHCLNLIDEYVFMLAKDLKRINETKIIPEIKNLNSNGIFEAIYNYDYILALQLSERYSYENSIANEQNIIYCFLKEIVNLINEIKYFNVEDNILKAIKLIKLGMISEDAYKLLDLKQSEIDVVEQVLNSNKKLIKK